MQSLASGSKLMATLFMLGLDAVAAWSQSPGSPQNTPAPPPSMGPAELLALVVGALAIVVATAMAATPRGRKA